MTRKFQGLKSATPAERWVLLEAEIQAERVFLQEIVGVLCALSDSGLAECADLTVACECEWWVRTDSSLFSSLKCVANRPGATRRFKWRLPRVPRTRACPRSPRK